MKKTLLIASVLATSFSYTPVSFAEDHLSRSICEYVAVNDKTRLRAFLKQRKLKIRSVFNDLLCNEKNILVFAASSNALDMGEFLIGQLPVKLVADNLEDIKKYSEHLTKVAEARIK